MATKKIGALITLDGEKEFRQNVTGCNKSLTALKSEMGLVKAQCEGQENSLESLRKKHEVLTKTLEEQKKKEEAVRKGLEHAQESYKKVGNGLETLNKKQEDHSKKLVGLQEEYDQAKKRLDEMVKSGNSSETAMKKQEAVVQSLSQQLKEEESALKEVNEAITKGEKNYQTAGNRVKDWETKLNTAEAQTIRATAALNKNAVYMKEAEQATDQCATSIDQFGKQVKKAEEVTVDFATVVKTNIGNTIVNFAKDATASAVKSVTSLESAQKQLQASTGATAGEMKQYKSVMENLHNSNYGDDINDVAKSMALVKQYTGEMDSSKLESMTENGIAMRDVFDMDLPETIRGVDSLVENMGLTSDEAFDLMAKGAQKGLNKSGELADNITEYSQLWDQAGFSAQEMFAILQNGLDSGAYKLDTVNDFVKEFTISLADGRIEKSLGSFSDGTQSLFYQWKQGKATSRDVFYSVINDLANAKNQQEALTIASSTWSALGEDNAMKVITSLADTNTAYDNVKGTMESIKDIKYDTLESRFEQLGKKFQTKVGVPIAEKVLPSIEKGLDLVIDNMDLLVPAMGAAAAGIATYKGVSTAVTLFTTATEGATVAQTVFNTAANANPVILVTTALVAATTAVSVYASKAGEASADVQALADRNEKLCESANEVSDSAQDMVKSYADSTEQMQAQGEYTKTLADRIEKLAGKTNRSNEETDVMRQYIAELNELVPGLNLAYDEQTKSLNKTSDAMEEYLNNSQKEIEIEAAKEQVIELIKKRSELEIEQIKLKNQGAEANEKFNEFLEEENGLYLETTSTLGAWLSGKADEKKTYDELAEAQEKNAEAQEKNKDAQNALIEEMGPLQEYLKQHGIEWDGLTASEDENTAATKENADAQTAAAEANSAAAATIVETYTGMQQTVSNVLDSQMNMFEEFNAGTEISSKKLLDNMQSQINGVAAWADNMAILAQRGVNQGILDKLAEMGPQGSTYVQAFANMSDDELKRANDMWSQSLDMKEGVHNSVQGMIEEYTASLNGGKEQVKTSMREIGVDISTGLGEGIKTAQNQGVLAVNEMGQAVITSANTTFDRHSPSKVFMDIGKDVVEGLAGGIQTSKGAAEAMRRLAAQLINAAKAQINEKAFVSIGKNITSGIMGGMSAGLVSLLLKATSINQSVKQKITQGMTQQQYAMIGKQVPAGLSQGIETGRTQVFARTQMLKSAVSTGASGLNSKTLYNHGLNVSYGLANGIRSGRSSVISSVSSVCAAAIAQARTTLRIHSPSKVFDEIGSYTAEGFSEGFESKMGEVNHMIQEAMEYRSLKTNSVRTIPEDKSTYQNMLEKIVIELPISVGKEYTRTEIVEIAMEGINRRQNGILKAKGAAVGV